MKNKIYKNLKEGDFAKLLSIDTNYAFNPTGDLMFNCEELIFKAGSIEIKIPEFLSLDGVKNIIFNIKGEKYEFEKKEAK